MTEHWPAVAYDRWGATCDTLHAHTQVLGKLAVELTPPEPELLHAALRLTARGWRRGTAHAFAYPAPPGFAGAALSPAAALQHGEPQREDRGIGVPQRVAVAGGDDRGATDLCSQRSCRLMAGAREP